MSNVRANNMRVYRPGTLMATGVKSPKALPVRHRSRFKKLFIVLVLLVGLGFGGYKLVTKDKTISYRSATGNSISSVSSKPLPETECSRNTAARVIIVVITKQQLWACNYNQVAYNSLVVTGYTGNPADITPTGTYSIYAKETDVTLTGSDGVTSWNDFVNYWMPFLYNRYGAYGLHDATWRNSTAFGHVSINSPDASHGCIECPLATAKWLYSWVSIGTEVTIKQSA